MSKGIHTPCWCCQYCENIGRQHSQKGQLGRKRYYCENPEASKLKDKRGFPLNTFIGYGDMTVKSPLVLKTHKKWCPLRKKDGGADGN